MDIATLCSAEYTRVGMPNLITYGFYSSPFGNCLLALVGDRICSLYFVGPDLEESVLELQKEWQRSCLKRDDAAISRSAEALFTLNPCSSPKLLLKGTTFQLSVWGVLCEIPRGELATYSDIAKRIGRERAVRAVGSAIGRNPVSFLIPCHRVLRMGGAMGGYRWGVALKKELLSAEGVMIAP